MRIAIIFTGDINNRKGKFNNIYERINQLKKVSGLDVDVFLIQYKYSWLFKKFKKVNLALEENSIINGITFKNLMVKLTLAEYISTYRLKLQDIACKKQLSKYEHRFKEYDILSVHGLLDLSLASSVKKKYGIPFVMTWHGSDINRYPFTNKKTFKSVKFFLEYADYNFFVSKELKRVSDKIAITNDKSHLYTGPSEIFNKKSSLEKTKIRENLNISSKHIIGFIGNIMPIKNVLVLPEIFREIQNKTNDVGFLIIGDGFLLDALQKQIEILNISNVIYMGKVQPEEVPDLMNALDVLLIPSLNEGLPRVTLEAQACGVHVVGSDVGGIPEAIGEKNCFKLGDGFTKNISNRVIEILENYEKPQSLSVEFSWDETIRKELKVYKSVIAN